MTSLPRKLTVGQIGLALTVLLVLLVPTFTKPGDLRMLTTTSALAIAALGLEVLVGMTGQLSLAHASFLGVGCFAAINVGGRGLPWPIAFIAAMVVCAAAATVVGLPSLRIRGLQVAIATLAFQEYATKYLFQQPWVNSGTRIFARPSYLISEKTYYYFGIGCIVIAALVLRRVRATRGGRSFVAVRDVEARAGAFGIKTGPTKLLAYAISGAICGLGGALYGLQQGSVSGTDDFDLQHSLLLVAVVVVGGMGSTIGILIAAFFLLAAPSLIQPSWFSFLPFGWADFVVKYFQTATSALLVVSVVAQPEGIGGVLRELKGKISALLGLSGERPSPRPMPPPEDAEHRAVVLRDVPRPLKSRMPTPELLVAADVGVQYGGVRALQAINLEVRRGEIVGLIGANGAGKSTFFNAVSGLAPVTGSITYRGRELVTAPSSSRSARGIARTFQDMGLVRAETVRDNVLLAQGWMANYNAAAGLIGLGSTVRTERELRVRADLALELFGLTHLADERLGDLPYGTMRITEIASAVAAGPELLMLDEASAGLTPDEAHSLGDRFIALRDELGLTLVVIEHHVPLIAKVCDYCYCLESGMQIADGTPDHVTSQPRVIESFLGRGSIEDSEATAAAAAKELAV